MAEIKGGEKLEAFLSDMAKKVSNPATLRVGFLEGGTYPDGTSIPMVAALNEYGGNMSEYGTATTHYNAPTPPRPFFRTMVANKSKGWARTLTKLLKENNYDAVEALNLMGDGIKGQLQDSIANGGWAPNKPSTLKRKAGTQPLIDTSDMWNSVRWEVKT